MPNFLLRLNDELYGKLRQRAFEEERPMSKWVREAIGEKLEATKKVPEQGGEASAPLPTTPPRPPAESLPKVEDLPRMPYGCPVMGCPYKSKSPKAVCGRHGRKVV